MGSQKIVLQNLALEAYKKIFILTLYKQWKAFNVIRFYGSHLLKTM